MGESASPDPIDEPEMSAKRPPRRRTVVRRIVRGLAGVALVGVVGIVMLLASMRIEHGTTTLLPAPTGSFAVGRTIFHWTDRAHPDPAAPAPGTPRELLVWIWYPASASALPRAADYLPARLREELQRARGGLITNVLTRDLSKVHGHSFRDADVSAQQSPFPVVIMRAGASAGVGSYATLAEDLASHGYVVVGFDAPYRTDVVVFPDGRVVTRTPENDPEAGSNEEQARRIDRLLAAWTRDIGFVLDRLEELNASDASGRFTRRLDLTRAGVFGHSFGGATAAQFCHDDARCKAGIDVDGQPFGSVVREGLHKPFMFLLSDHGDSSDDASRQIQTNIQSIYDRQPLNGRLRVSLVGASHFLFSDDGALLKSHILLRALRLFGAVGLDGRRQLEVTAYCVRTFFDAYLKGDGKMVPNLVSLHYPEIHVK